MYLCILQKVVAHGQKDITNLVSLVRIKVFEVDGGGSTGRGQQGGGKGRREVENKKLVQLVSILTNQIFRSILDTRADLKERRSQLLSRAKAAEEKTIASYGTRREGELCEREIGSRIREREEEEDDAGRELRDLEECQGNTWQVEERLARLLEEQDKVQEEQAANTQGGLDGHRERLSKNWNNVEEKQRGRQSRLEKVALEREEFATRIEDQVGRQFFHHICHNQGQHQVHKDHVHLVETIEDEAKKDIAR